MDKDVVLGIVRHVITGLGSIAVAKGVIDDSMLTTGVAAVITLVGLVWSVIAKKKPATP